MSRHSRIESDSGIFHVIMRGINKQIIFEDDEDKQRFLETVVRYKEICKYEIYSYCLMSNHIHLLLKESNESISNIIKRISSSYVFWYNKKYGRCGHLFQERFKSEVVLDDSYFLTGFKIYSSKPSQSKYYTQYSRL